MKSREEREKELTEMSQSPKSQALVLLAYLDAGGDQGSLGAINTPYSDIIKAILDREYPRKSN
jgi:hypothetical protein